MNLIAIILMLMLSTVVYGQPISHQNWQTVTISADAISVSCAQLLLPAELGRLLVEADPTNPSARGEMDKSLRSAHPVKVALQPESGTSDDITSITGCTINGATIQLSTVDTGDTITVVHTPGAIEFFGGNNVVLSSPTQILTLQRKSGVWVSDGGLGGGAGGNIEDMPTLCPFGQFPISDGAGGSSCWWDIVRTPGCGSYTDVGTVCLDTDASYGPKLFLGRGSDLGVIPRMLYFGSCVDPIDVGDFCQDWDDGTLYYGTAEGNLPLGAPGAGGTQSLDSAFDIGKVIDGASDEASAMVVGNGTDGFKFYVGTTGPIMKCFQGGNSCDITLDIPAGKSFRLKYNGTDGITIDSSGNVTLANALLEYRTFWLGAGALSTDSTNCTNPEEKLINGGPKMWTIKCSDNNASIIYGNMAMPDSYTGGNLLFKMHSVNENAAPSGNLQFTVSAMCRASGNTINASWGTGVTMTTSFSTQYNIRYSDVISVAPNGSCAASEQIFWRAVMNETNTTTQVANTYIIGMQVEYPTDDWSDNF